MSNSDRQGDTIRSNRFSTWLGLLVFSVITLLSAVESAKSSNISTQGERYQGLALTFSSICFSLALIATLLHLNATCSVFFVGTKIEGFICLVLMFLWVGTVIVVTNPQNDLAVDKNGAVSNGNLYYFSWFGLIASVILETSFFQDVYHVDVAGQFRERSARLSYWSSLMVCSCVVMGTSANTFHTDCKVSYKGAVFCNRTVFAITLGTICGALSLFFVTMKIVTQQTFFVAEALISTLLSIAWAFGVTLITGENGPGAPLGNLYYFTWGSFLLSFILFSGLYEDYLGLKHVPPQGAERNNYPVEESI